MYNNLPYSYSGPIVYHIVHIGPLLPHGVKDNFRSESVDRDESNGTNFRYQLEKMAQQVKKIFRFANLGARSLDWSALFPLFSVLEDKKSQEYRK